MKLVFHLLLVLAAVLLIAYAGRLIARSLRQPEVIGEIVAGLLAGPALIAMTGPQTFHALLPEPVLSGLKLFSQLGLVLFLVGLSHKLRIGSGGPRLSR